MSTEYLPYFEVKEVGEDGTFVGIASVYGVEDLGGDVIDKGAFTKTIAENPVIPILWQHQTGEVIGTGTVSEWQGKIMLKGSLDIAEDPTASKAYKKMKKGLIKGLSIGFQTIKRTFEETADKVVRHIVELKLWEVSVVTFPMLPAAQITRVKNAEEDAALIAELQRLLEDKNKQLQALQANQVTTPPQAGAAEPAQAEEPPPQQSVEPAKFHSSFAVLGSALLRSYQ